MAEVLVTSADADRQVAFKIVDGLQRRGVIARLLAFQGSPPSARADRRRVVLLWSTDVARDAEVMALARSASRLGCLTTLVSGAFDWELAPAPLCAIANVVTEARTNAADFWNWLVAEARGDDTFPLVAAQYCKTPLQATRRVIAARSAGRPVATVTPISVLEARAPEELCDFVLADRASRAVAAAKIVPILSRVQHVVDDMGAKDAADAARTRPKALPRVDAGGRGPVHLGVRHVAPIVSFTDARGGRGAGVIGACVAASAAPTAMQLHVGAVAFVSAAAAVPAATAYSSSLLCWGVIVTAAHAAAPRAAAIASDAAPGDLDEFARSGPAIGRVLVEGNQRIEPTTITSYLSIGPGDAVDVEQIDIALKTLFSTGLFSDARIERRGDDLVVSVRENPIVNRVSFEGVGTLGPEDLDGEVQARARSVFTPARAEADARRILERYRRVGHFSAQVTPQVRELDHNRVDLIFEVDEGPVTGVRDVIFSGSETFSDRTLRDVIEGSHSHWWNAFQDQESHALALLRHDQERLRRFHNDRGYADFHFVSAVAHAGPGQGGVVFTIEEGVKYEFGDVGVEAKLKGLTPEMWRAWTPSREGELFRGDRIEDAIEGVMYVAGTAGHANVDITTTLARDAASGVGNVAFTVNEGLRVVVERIDVVGVADDYDLLVRRALGVREGDAVNRLLLARARIDALGFEGEAKVDDLAQPSDRGGDAQAATGPTSSDAAALLRGRAGVSLFWDSPFGPVEFTFGEPLFGEDIAADAEKRSRARS